MGDYISRQAVLAKQYESEGTCGLSTMVVDVRDIEDAPAADVVPVVRASWDDFGEESTWACSACGEPWTLTCGTPDENHMNHCPHCGARMDKEATP